MSYTYGDDDSQLGDQNVASSQVSGILSGVQLEQVAVINEEMSKRN